MTTEPEATTAADFLDAATARLDALCRAPLTDAERELWRIAAQHNAALRAIVERTAADPR
jgi:hypothetical protein